MRDRLIELIEQKQVYGVDQEQERPHEIALLDNDVLADHLLANGVIVPPCKVGDKVYVITERHPCYACKWCGDFCHKDCHVKDKQKLVVKEAKVFYFLFQEMHKEMSLAVEGTKHLQMHFLHFNLDEFGKTVFLTREEAEKALKKGK